jgi:hypothetical protein
MMEEIPIERNKKSNFAISPVDSLTRDRNRYLLNIEKSMSDTLSEEELAEASLKEELRKDFRKLFREARKTKGDSVSKRIVGSIDEWLRIELECAIE